MWGWFGYHWAIGQKDRGYRASWPIRPIWPYKSLLYPRCRLSERLRPDNYPPPLRPRPRGPKKNWFEGFTLISGPRRADLGRSAPPLPGCPGLLASEVPMGHEIRHRDPFGVCASVLVYRGSVTESLRVRNCTAPGSRYPVNLELLPSGKCFSPRTWRGRTLEISGYTPQWLAFPGLAKPRNFSAIQLWGWFGYHWAIGQKDRGYRASWPIRPIWPYKSLLYPRCRLLERLRPDNRLR